MNNSHRTFELDPEIHVVNSDIEQQLTPPMKVKKNIICITVLYNFAKRHLSLTTITTDEN